MEFGKNKAILREAVRSWAERGLLDPQAAAALEADIGPDTPGRGFSNFIILAGVISLIFGAITFVAANWDGMARLTRVGVILAGLWAAWGTTLWARLRGHPWIAACTTLLACGLFGAGIMLISQMYHIQGEPRDAVFLWLLGTLAAAALAQSPPALALAVGHLVLWYWLDQHGRDAAQGLRWVFPPLWLAAAGVCLWLRSRAVAHLLAIAIIFWVLGELLFLGAPAEAFVLTSALCLVGIAFALVSHATRRALRGFEPQAIAYLLALAGLVLLPLYLDGWRYDLHDSGEIRSLWWRHGASIAALALGTAFLAWTAHRRTLSTTYDIWISAAFIVAVALVFQLPAVPMLREAMLLAMAIWGMRLGYRLEARLLRIFGGAAFAGVMLLVYARTVGSLLGTSAFYLGAGVLMLAGAFIGARLGRRAEDKS